MILCLLHAIFCWVEKIIAGNYWVGYFWLHSSPQARLERPVSDFNGTSGAYVFTCEVLSNYSKPPAVALVRWDNSINKSIPTPSLTFCLIRAWFVGKQHASIGFSQGILGYCADVMNAFFQPRYRERSVLSLVTFLQWYRKLLVPKRRNKAAVIVSDQIRAEACFLISNAEQSDSNPTVFHVIYNEWCLTTVMMLHVLCSHPEAEWSLCHRSMKSRWYFWYALQSLWGLWLWSFGAHLTRSIPFICSPAPGALFLGVRVYGIQLCVISWCGFPPTQ